MQITHNSTPQPPLRLALEGGPGQVSRALGMVTDAVLRGEASVLVFDLGRDAVDPQILGALGRWHKRNDARLRASVRAMVYVVPRFWHRVQWRLAVLLERNEWQVAIVATAAQAEAWLTARDEVGGGAGFRLQ